MSQPDLLFALRTWGRQRAGELRARLSISPPTLMRAARAVQDQVIVRGVARRSTYAARRALRGSLEPVPLYRIDERGSAHDQGLVNLTYPDGSVLDLHEPLEWPVLDAGMQDGWYDGLPYPLLDMRPQGFLGRNFARANANLLQVDDDPHTWSDDDAVHALSLLGMDVSGNFILGEPAYRLWLQYLQAPPSPIRDEELAVRYAQLADAALQHGVAGSSAGGEFPKFTAVRQGIDRAGRAKRETRHVIVKFSGNDGSQGSQRWSDLLVCEHLAARVVGTQLGLPASQTSLHQAAGRTFLEVVRFDRHGAHGRSGLLSLQSANGAFVGAHASAWPVTVARLAASGLVCASALGTTALLWHFGRLIANTDMHEGNLSFQPALLDEPGLRVAPVYDMVPMLYAPSRGVEIVQRPYAPQLPLPGERQAWQAAARAASIFWDEAACDERISAAFRKVCSRNVDILRGVASHPAAN